jgi:hypothetical protein
MVNTTWFPIG